MLGLTEYVDEESSNNLLKKKDLNIHKIIKQLAHIVIFNKRQINPVISETIPTSDT